MAMVLSVKQWGTMMEKMTEVTERRIPAAKVREMCGGVSDMTLWRWLNEPEIEFPRPAYIGRRRYWRETDVVAWLNAQQGDRA